MPRFLTALLTLALAQSAAAQHCTHLLPDKPVPDVQYYADNGYTIAQIKLISPFDFFFLVPQALNIIKRDLPIQEKEPLSRDAYDRSFKQVDAAVTEDSAFGENSPVKIVVTTGGLENCDEREGHKTVDVTYHIFSTDPVPALRATPEQRKNSVEEPATSVAEQNTQGSFRLKPLLGYDHTFKGLGGGEVVARLPGKIIDELHLLGTGSSTSLLLDGELSGSRTPHLRALDSAEYHLGYHYDQSPSGDLKLASGSAHASFTGSSKSLTSPSAPTVLRYGASLEQGLQQSNLQTNIAVSNTLTNSAYGALRMYVGSTTTTRYSDTSLSYGLEVGGAGLSSLTFTKQVGDLSYSLRVPGGTHSPWNVQARVTAGGITGGPIVLNDRFFGGNVVTTFIPGDSWHIPNGPLVRSIAANLIKGRGVGGTSFYSTNLTVGKVVKYWPLIPTSIEKAEGFESGVSAAEDTAQGFFMDGYLAKSKEFQDLATDCKSKLSEDLDKFQSEFKKIRASVSLTPQLRKALTNTESQAHLAQANLLHLDSSKLRPVNSPKSRFVLLLGSTAALLPLIPDDLRPDLEAAQAALQGNLADLKKAIDTIDKSAVGDSARANAVHDMARPREVVDTLQHEATSVALSLFGIFDTGRVWPDPYGTRYGYGGGIRLSLVNVNFNLGYAVNPRPQQSLGEGRGALLVFISYTNLFR